jgi:hypothetical protein
VAGVIVGPIRENLSGMPDFLIKLTYVHEVQGYWVQLQCRLWKVYAGGSFLEY